MNVITIILLLVVAILLAIAVSYTMNKGSSCAGNCASCNKTCNENVKTENDNLSNIKVGETVKVIGINGKGNLKRHIMDMGITKGVSIYVRKVAPLGDPIEIMVRGYELSMRKEDAKNIDVMRWVRV